MMTEDDAIKRLKECDALDREAAHSNADETLVIFLREHGHARLAEAFEKMSDTFWYA